MARSVSKSPNPLGLKRPDFEGIPIVGTPISLRGAGDGLSKALEVEPIELEVGDYVAVVTLCDVTAVNFPTVKTEEGSVHRLHVLRAREGMVIDMDLVQKPLDAMRERIAAREREAEERRSGQEGMIGGDGEVKEGLRAGE